LYDFITNYMSTETLKELVRINEENNISFKKIYFSVFMNFVKNSNTQLRSAT